MNLYEIYKISEGDKQIVALPFGEWEASLKKLVVVEADKELRRQDLMVKFFSSVTLPILIFHFHFTHLRDITSKLLHELHLLI